VAFSRPARPMVLFTSHMTTASSATRTALGRITDRRKGKRGVTKSNWGSRAHWRKPRPTPSEVSSRRARTASTPVTSVRAASGSRSRGLRNESPRSIRILDFGLWPIAARGRLGMPAAVLVLVFDNLRVARHTLFGRGPAGCCEGLGVSRKRLGEHTVDRVRPAVVVPHDSICHMRHPFTCRTLLLRTRLVL